MATSMQALQAYVDTRDYFSGGLRSGNKRYERETFNPGTKLATATNVSQFAAQQRIARRNQNQPIANLRAGQDNAVGQTPVGFGHARVNAAQTHGNCGAMACVAMYYASLQNVPLNEMWLCTATNPNTRKGVFGQTAMTFGHSWALLGTMANGEFIVDPWAGVACPVKDYVRHLSKRLDEWAAKGKRIGVNWSNGSEWMTANDPAILSLVANNATTTGKGRYARRIS